MASSPSRQQSGARPDELGDQVDWLRHLARRLVTDGDTAEDLVQETLIAAHYQPWSRSAPLRPWLRGILRNLFRMGARTEHRRRQREHSAHVMADMVGPPVPDPEELAMRRALTEELEALAEPYRTTLRLRFLDGARATEIAAALGVPADRVRKRTETGLELLRRRLDDRHDGDKAAWRRRAWLFALGARAKPSATAALGQRWFARTFAALALGTLVLPLSRGCGANDRASHAGQLPALSSPRLAPREHAALLPRAAAADHGVCGTIQALVDAAPRGGTVVVPPCLYREDVVIDKPLVLQGAAGAEIRGSDVWGGFVRAGTQWKSVDRVPSKEVAVYLDGQRLRRVDATRPHEQGIDQHGIDEEGRIVLSSDPSGRLVEVAVRPFWVRIEADDVTITGLAMRHTNGAGERRGGLSVRRGRRATITSNHLEGAGAVALSIAGGAGHVVTDNEIDGAGEMGAHLTNVQQVRLEGNKITNNGRNGRGEASWRAAGVSLVRSGAVLAGNVISHNRGIGVFCVACADAVVRDNAIFENAGAGIIDMSSQRSEIRANRIWSNGWRTRPWEPAVIVASSRHTRVEGNIFAWNPGAVVLLNKRRGDIKECQEMVGNVVSSNEIFHAGTRAEVPLEWRGSMGDRDVCPSPSGERNQFWYDRPEWQEGRRFVWSGHKLDLAAFQGTPAGVQARLLSDGDKDAILDNAAIPTTPPLRGPYLAAKP